MIRTSIQVIALFGATATGAVAGPQPDGTYSKGTLAPITFNCPSVHDCIASYNESGKRSYLLLSSDAGDGHFAGFWAEPKAKHTCETRNFGPIETDAWGPVEFWFDPDGEAWNGYWSYCDDDTKQDWTGAR